MNSPSCPCCGAALRVCPACLAVFAASAGRGRPRRFCSDGCRWRHDHRAARERAAAARGLPGIGDLPGIGELPALDALPWPG